jgi:hypothetical protein
MNNFIQLLGMDLDAVACCEEILPIGMTFRAQCFNAAEQTLLYFTDLTD